jgi:hypothetical protein
MTSQQRVVYGGLRFVLYSSDKDSSAWLTSMVCTELHTSLNNSDSCIAISGRRNSRNCTVADH